MAVIIGSPVRRETQAEAGGPARRIRRIRRWISPRGLIAVLALAVVVVIALRSESAKDAFVASFADFRTDRLWWLAVAVGAETASLFCYGLAQRRLLTAGGARISRRTALSLTLGSTGISSLVPVGVVPASGWLVAQYRHRGVRWPLALWAVLAGGFAATVSVLALVLVGAGAAGVAGPLVLIPAGAVLFVGSAAFVVAVNRLDRFEHWAAARGWERASRWTATLATKADPILSHRAGLDGGAAVFAYSSLNWLCDALCLVAAFGLGGQPLPWRAALFAFAMAQVAGSLSPLPAGIGVVEGGLVGAFSLAGVPVGGAFAATVIYRVIGYWALAGVGTLVVLVMSHRLGRAGMASDEFAPGEIARDDIDPAESADPVATARPGAAA